MASIIKFPCNVLAEDDVVHFPVERGVIQQYEVSLNYLRGMGITNGAIFDTMGVNALSFCTEAYGYPANPGGCPECRPRDAAALTRLVRAIYLKLQGGPRDSEERSIMEADKASLTPSAVIPSDKKGAQRVAAWLKNHPSAFGGNRSEMIEVLGEVVHFDLKSAVR